MDKFFKEEKASPSLFKKMVTGAFATTVLPVAMMMANAQPAQAAYAPIIPIQVQQVVTNIAASQYRQISPADSVSTDKAPMPKVFPTSALVLGTSTPSVLYNTIDYINSIDNNGELDLARETNLRYLGYANETGESFKFIFPQFLGPSYAIAYGYCLGDALYKSLHWYFNNSEVISSGIYKTFADALIFQCFASVLIPGNIIAFIVERTEEKLKETDLDDKVKKWGPTLIGLGAIPFIVHPIDVSVDFAMDHTIRLLYTLF